MEMPEWVEVKGSPDQTWLIDFEDELKGLFLMIKLTFDSRWKVVCPALDMNHALGTTDLELAKAQAIECAFDRAEELVEVLRRKAWVT
jgi:hypothetical protein